MLYASGLESKDWVEHYAKAFLSVVMVYASGLY